MTITLIGTVATDVPDNVTSYAITVPTGVTTAHLGVMIYSTADAGSTHTASSTGWTARATNPAGEGNTEVTILTRLGGHTAGGTLTLTLTAVAAGRVTVAWFDTQGRNLSLVGTPWTRNATSSASIQFPGSAGASAGADMILVGAERTGGTGLTITGWSPSTPTVDLYSRSADTATRAIGHVIAHATLAAAGTSTTYTATISAAGTNAVGQQFVLNPSNSAPTVNAGPDQTSEPWSTVTLTATAADPDGTTPTVSWAQTAGTPAVILAGSGATRTFTAPGTLAGTTLTFTATASDGSLTGTDAMTVAVLPASERVMVGGSWVPAVMRTVGA